MKFAMGQETEQFYFNQSYLKLEWLCSKSSEQDFRGDRDWSFFPLFPLFFFLPSKLLQVSGRQWEIEVEIVQLYSSFEWKRVWGLSWLQSSWQCRIKLSKSCPQHSFTWRCPRRTSGAAPEPQRLCWSMCLTGGEDFWDIIPCHRGPRRLLHSRMVWYRHNTSASSARRNKSEAFSITGVQDRGCISTSQHPSQS